MIGKTLCRVASLEELRELNNSSRGSIMVTFSSSRSWIKGYLHLAVAADQAQEIPVVLSHLHQDVDHLYISPPVQKKISNNSYANLK